MRLGDPSMHGGGVAIVASGLLFSACCLLHALEDSNLCSAFRFGGRPDCRGGGRDPFPEGRRFLLSSVESRTGEAKAATTLPRRRLRNATRGLKLCKESMSLSLNLYVGGEGLYLLLLLNLCVSA